MSTIRFALVAVGLFALSFVGMSWANKGFPVLTVHVVPLKPGARIPTFEESVKKGQRRDWENARTSQSDGNQERDGLRLALLQASTAYKLSPCDDTMKKNMVRALTDYTNAWHDMAFCRPGIGNCMGSMSDRIDAAAAAFKTPADAHVHEAVREALDEGGIAREDFPSAIRDHVFMWSGMPSREPRAACIIARQNASRR